MARATFQYTDTSYTVYLSYTRTVNQVDFDPLGPQCVGCSVPYVHAKAMEFMVEHNIREVFLDGVPIRRTS